MRYINEVTDEDGWINWQVANSSPVRRRVVKNARAHGLKVIKRSNTARSGASASESQALPGAQAVLTTEKIKIDPVDDTIPLRRTLSPMYGAYSNDIFDPTSQKTSAWVLHYTMTVVYPMFVHRPRVLTSVLNDRLEMFSKWHSLFHSYHFVAAAHWDMMHNRLDRYRQPEMIWHKAEAIRHLNTMISDVNDTNIDITIVAILYLDYGELGDHCFSKNLNDEPFHPPQPPFSWMQDEWNRVPPVEMHAKAIYQLVAMAGGVKKLKLSALSDTLCRWDLRRASINLQRPRIECLGTIDETILQDCLSMLDGSPDSPGYGFRSLNGLSSALSSILLMLAAINRLLLNASTVDGHDHFRLRDARTVLHHRLMSIASWDSLSEDHRVKSDRTIYECCRLTAILYSNGTLLGMPPQAGWILTIATEIRKTVQEAKALQSYDNAWPALIWTLILACIVSRDTKDYRFFEESLQEMMKQRQLSSWVAVESLLNSFLWSSSACNRSALWCWEKISA